MNIHIYNYLKHNICLTKTKIQLHILITWYMLSVVDMFDYHPFSTVTWCLLQKGYHCVWLSVSDTGRIQIVGSIYLFIIIFIWCIYHSWMWIWHSSDPVSLMHCRFDMYTCIKEEDTLFTKYRPTRGMNIHIYNYLKHNICLTKTKIQLDVQYQTREVQSKYRYISLIK
jgi:hypothetical protein